MILKQFIKYSDTLFKNNNLKLTPALLEVLEEGEQIIEDIKNGKRKGYHNVNKLFDDLDDSIDTTIIYENQIRKKIMR